MESIPGFRTSRESSEFLNQVNTIGMSVIGQTAHITPADKKLYALRDVTATVDSFGLIASSIMSKAGIRKRRHSFRLKVGNGASWKISMMLKFWLNSWWKSAIMQVAGR